MSSVRIGEGALRSPSRSDYDAEINDLISAAQDDLRLVGVTDEAAYNESPLVKRAILTYVKANFGWNNPDAERLAKSYESIRNGLSLSEEYGYYTVTFTVTATGVPVREAMVTFDGEVKYTNVSGSVVFYRRPGSNYAYTVSADGYISDDDDLNLVDVTTLGVNVAIAMVA